MAKGRSIEQTISAVKGIREESQKAMKRLMSDVRKRAPGWISAEVTKEYGIKKAEIPKVGTVKVIGRNVMNAKIRYRGRVLTPIHFSMTPKTPRESYTLKAEVIRGQKKVLGKKKKLTKKQRTRLPLNFEGKGQHHSPKSPIMLMNAGGGTYIPFQRKSQNRNDIEAIKTISVPQMVSSDRTRDGIQATLEENIRKRLDHHTKSLQK